MARPERSLLVAYFLELNEKTVAPYLRQFELSRSGRLRLYDGLNGLRGHADVYLNDASQRLSPGSQYFWYEYLFRDGEGDGRYHLFRFVVSDARAKYGVLRIDYVDETSS